MHSRHSICVINSEQDYFSLYENVVTDRLSKGHGVLYVAEEGEGAVTRRMSEANIDTEKHLRNGSLRIISTSSFYSIEKTRLCCELLKDACQTSIRRMMHDSSVNGVLIVGSCRAFTDTSKYDELVLYENAINRHILGVLPADFVCCYAAPRLSQISPIRLASIMYHHTHIVSGKNKELNSNTSGIAKIIKNTFDESLGDGCSDLIFKTIKLVYKLDPQCLYSEPGVFEKKLISMLGSKAANMVFDALKKRLVNHLLLSGDNNSNVTHMAKERK